ncbi:MAG: Nif3-like dinuclear metal center hexameric protein [Fimbriimonadaceae bacterium]
MTTDGLLDELFELTPWINRSESEDGVLYGSGKRQVKRVSTVWMPSLKVVREASRGGVDLLIVHEPLFYSHETDPKMIVSTKAAREKAANAELTDLVIARLHDVLDQAPSFGIPYSLGRFLGFHEPEKVSADRYHHRYRLEEETTVDAFAERVAQKVSRYGDPGVQVIGDGSRSIKTVGVGTGTIARPAEFRKLDCDLFILTDDGSTYYSEVQQCIDSNEPVIRLNHGSSEEPGMEEFADWLQRSRSTIEVTHIPHRSPYRFIS